MKDKNLHILIIASWFKSPEYPLSGIFIEDQARMLMKNGHQVTLVHPYLKGTFWSSLKDRKSEISEEIDTGLKIIRIGVAPSGPKMRQQSYNKLKKVTFKTISNLFVGTNKFDLIHSHAMFMGGIIGHYLSTKMNIPMVLTEHSSGLLFNPNQHTKKDVQMLHKVYLQTKAVFFVSNFMLKNITKFYALHKFEKYHVIGNVVDKSFFSIQKAVGTFSYLIIGSLIEVKNHSLLLKAWKLVLQKYPKSTLTIAGNGPYKKSLLFEAEKLNISYSILWKPQLNRSQVKFEIDKHHVLISTSKMETFGMTVAESLASGKPVVTTDSGGIRDFVDANNGIITESNIKEISLSLIQIQKNYEHYNGQAISTKCYIKFQENTIYNLLNEQYQKHT
jgi:glycosyltransferase involved in cell wall biosynthesis